MKIEQRKLSELKNWEKNPRSIKEKDFERLKKQITDLKEFKPLIITADGTVLGGNMRLRAYKDLGITDVWVSVVEAPDEATKLRYALADNDRAGFYDSDLLANLTGEFPDFLWENYAVDLSSPITITNLLRIQAKDESEYTKKIISPIYEPSGKKVTLSELVDKEKVNQLLDEINKSSISQEIKDFLIISAYRHYKFTYSKIADYYVSASDEVKKLMEKSALVIIDYNKAIENGFAELINEITELEKNE